MPPKCQGDRLPMLKWQVGRFFVFLGLILLVLFYISDQIKAPDYGYFCSGVLVLLLGGYLMWLGRGPTTPSERFRALRKLRQKGEKK
jgi:hypothetical protein